MIRVNLICFSLLLLLSCSKTEQPSSPMFVQMGSADTGIQFQNTLEYSEDFNIYKYRNFYNGGGVAIGDINNDGLVDVYFTGNTVSNRLYLNQGNFQFKDITENAGVAGQQSWSTGVSMVDINGDGLLDIYVCNSGNIEGDNKQNELFINQGNMTFLELAESYGLADRGFSTHAGFFDFDKDGDLDVYLLNNSFKAIGSFNLMKNVRNDRDSIGGDKLFRNDGNSFTDISEEAGIYGSIIGFGLGVTIGDLNKDNWPDIYISNDFFERDYLYINQKDGTFIETLEDQMQSISAASMGADMADFNNDGRPDIFVTDMLPEHDSRLKQVSTFEDWDKYQYNIKNGYYHQFIRNMLHLNNGDGSFSEIGRLAGVDATDWSWGALIFDMDNDGLKDIFVANGIYQDLTDLDYINFISNEQTKRAIITQKGVNYKALIDSIPINPIPNYAYKNEGNLSFVNKADSWGLSQPSHSNGSAYGDLDNDGDLDLVVNNVNSEAFIYRNDANQLNGNHYLKFVLQGTGNNKFGMGAQIIVKHEGQQFYLEQMPVRGFQSTMDARPNLGLGSIEIVDSVMVIWPDDKANILTNVKTNQTLTIDQSEASPLPSKIEPTEKNSIQFSDITNQNILDFQHSENQFVDFDRNKLTYHMLSNQGPKVATGDIDGDNLTDVYIGGAKGISGSLFKQKANGEFELQNLDVLQKDKGSEDIDCEFFDADNDGDLDLYVTSGGNEFGAGSNEFTDRLYLNTGSGQFKRSTQNPWDKQKNSNSTVEIADIDGDGDMDLFVGSRLRPFLYGVPASGYIYLNDGTGTFTDVTSTVAPELKDIGMITDATWIDFDDDDDLDLIVTGEWMAIEIFQNEQGVFNRLSGTGLDKSNGWWSAIVSRDLDNDGDIDLVLGNHGTNSKFSASEEAPLAMYVNDFDKNGTAEQILARFEDGKFMPYALKHDLVAQMPILKKKYLRFRNYLGQGVEDIFTEEQLKNSIILTANELRTSVAWNNGDGTFTLKALPRRAQFSPIYAIQIEDFNEDGNLDLLIGGNFHRSKPEAGKYDANYGQLLLGGKNQDFKVIPSAESGFFVKGEIRDLESIKTSEGNLIIAAKNNDRLSIFKF